MRRVTLAAFAAMALLAGNPAGAAPIVVDGILFPGGAASFADAVVSYAPGADVGAGWNDPDDALGLPDGSAASLGNGGSLILRFLDNSLTTSGDATADLHVFEIGAVTEFFNLSISTNGISWIDLGNVLGQPTSVDIDGAPGVVAGAQYSFVRLLDVTPDQTGSPFGEADIDAVGAIASAPPAPVAEPSSAVLMVGGLLALLRRSVRRARVASPSTP